MTQKVNFDSLDEIQVKASGYQAEHGGSLGGVVNVITRSGGNTFHGDVLGYYSGSALSGKRRDVLRINPLDNHAAEYVNYDDLNGRQRETTWEAGVSLGGYVFKDRLWFFGTFTPVQRSRTRPMTFVSDGSKAEFSRKDTEINYSAKLTVQPFGNLRVSASLVNNFWKYRGDLPANDGSGDPHTQRTGPTRPSTRSTRGDSLRGRTSTTTWIRPSGTTTSGTPRTACACWPRKSAAFRSSTRMTSTRP